MRRGGLASAAYIGCICLTMLVVLAALGVYADGARSRWPAAGGGP
jgi:hypothetical protein